MDHVSLEICVHQNVRTLDEECVITVVVKTRDTEDAQIHEDGIAYTTEQHDAQIQEDGVAPTIEQNNALFPEGGTAPTLEQNVRTPDDVKTP